jgi:hypothetical protein
VILTTVTAGSAAGPADPRLVAHTRIREIRKGRRNVFSPLFTHPFPYRFRPRRGRRVPA